MNWKNLIIRSLTGIVFLTVMITGTLWNVCSYGVLYSIVVALTMTEFQSLVSTFRPNLNAPNGPADAIYPTRHTQRILFPLLGVALFVLSILSAGGWISGGWLMLIPLIVLGIFCTVMFRCSTLSPLPLFQLALSVFGLVYIALPFAMTAPLVMKSDGSFSPSLLLSVFAFIWLSDSAAYFFGSLLGRHRLCQRISPKKSWEGSVGGFFFALLLGYIFSIYFPQLSCANWLILASISVVFGTLGDLFESMVKRILAIKDSGTFLPGHGGMLDRFDAALFALPAATAFLMLVL